MKDREGQLNAVIVLNCIYMSSSVIPILLIAKKFFDKNWKIIISLITLVLMPTFSMTMTFMSENIYLPLCLWNFYLCIVVMKESRVKYKIVKSIWLGFLNYLLYLNKEIGLSFLIAYILVEGIGIFVDKSRRKPVICGLMTVMISFTVCFFIMKLTIFKGMGNSYDQMSVDAIASADRFCFMFYAFLYNSLFAVMAFFVLPVVLPVMRWKYLNKIEKKTFAYVLLTFFIMAFVIAYTISVREDWGETSIRQHLRYLEPLFPVLFILFFSSLLKQVDIQNSRRRDRCLHLLPVLLSVFIVWIPDRIREGSYVDGFMLRYYEIAQDVLGGRLIFLRAAIAIFVIAISIVAYKKNYVPVTVLLIGGMWGICMVNNVTVYDEIKKAYSVSTELEAEWYSLNSFMEEKSETLLVIMRGWYEEEAKAMDTFLDVDAEYVEIEDVASAKGYLENMENFSYILVCPSRKIEDANGKEIMKVGGYTLYEVADSKAVNFTENPCFPVNDNEKRTVTASEGKFYTQFGMKEGKYSYVSGKREGFLVHGPYTSIYPGIYDVTIYYEYEGEMVEGEVIGKVDLKYNEESPNEFVELKAGNNQVELKNISVREFYDKGEIRIYTNVPGVRFLKAEIYRH